MRQILVLARGRAAEVFDRAYGLSEDQEGPGWTWTPTGSSGSFRRSTSWE